jgi:solute:Na+ symporter, SSS family
MMKILKTSGLLLGILTSGRANAQPIGESSGDTSLTLLDGIVIVAYGALMLGIGWYYSSKNKTREDYLLGGRTMNPIAVGISLFATLLSTLSYLSYPGEMIQHGPVIFAGMFAFPFVYYAAGWWLIPRIMRMNVTSAYEILERRFGLSVRMMATFMFLTLRFLWMATIVYVTVEIALFSVVPFEQKYALPIGVLLMVITIVYTAMGGIKAVVLTDVLQSIIFLGGAFLSILMVCYHFGSFTSWLPEGWSATWDSPKFGLDFTERSTFANAMLMIFIWYICTIGSDQMAIQRYLSTKDIKAARQSLRVSLYTNLLAKALLGLVGLAVFAFFTHNPHLLAKGKSIQEQADTLFPRFIVVALPSGLSGLVVAGLLAAAMSSLSSGINSVSSVISEDLLERFRKSKSTAEGLLRQVKNLSYLIGTLVIVLSIFVGHVEGNLFDVVTKVVNLFVGPLFVLFFLALFVPFATSAGALSGGMVSILSAFGIAFFGLMGISVFWILPMSLLVGIVTGVLVSFFESKFINSRV